MSDDVLFECDFSVDELAVLADLLEIPALPGGDPDFEFSEDAKAAAARGLLARGVVVANGPAGTVEITQPYATMVAIVLFATAASVFEEGAVGFSGETAAVTVRPSVLPGVMTWSASRRSAEHTMDPVLHAVAGDGRVEIDRQTTTVSTTKRKK
jgi:hypothetical protein